MEASIQLAKELNSKLALFTVYSVTGVAGPDPGSTVMAIRAACDSCKKTLAEAEQKVKSEAIEVETQVAEGNAVDEIVKKSKEGRFDLIVMGGRGISSEEDSLLGGMARKLTNISKVSCLVIK